MFISLILAAIPVVPFAPTSLGEKILEFQIENASGLCADDRGHSYLAIFGPDGRYVTYQLEYGSEQSNEGTYVYERLNATCCRLVYHMEQGGAWQGGDWEEILNWTSIYGGTVAGGQVELGGGCCYEGTFTMPPQ